jgi:hypothetical protein
MRVPPEAPTIRTPLPLPQTVIDPAPAPPPMPRRRSIAILAPILLIAVIAVMWAMRPRNDVPQEPAKTASTTQAATIPPQPATTTIAPPSQTSIDVTTTTATPLLQPATTTTATEPKPAPAKTTHQTAPPPPVPQPAPQPQHTEPAVPVPAPVPTGATYTEGGDGDANGAAVEKARTALSGVTHVSVVNAGDPALTEQLIKNLTGSGIEVGPGADVTIQFSGTLEHIGRGRKRRTAHATVIRHGHAVFRYELPPEEYRVGDTPAEAFARVLRDAMGK